MQNILVLGAGKSSFYLLEYLAKIASENFWKITACDKDADTLSAHTQNIKGIYTQQLDISNTENLESLIQDSNLVVSLLPPALHPTVARFCLKHKAHLATASYVSPEMQLLHQDACENQLVFLNEMGLDPGIDHMSAVKMLDEIKSVGGEITSFESYCGGLVCEEDCADNPWKYKFSWNPMNVILAGQGGMSVFRQDQQDRYIPWPQLFAHSQELDIPGMLKLEAYPNRDSLGYMNLYGLSSAKTFLRGTLRRMGFCKSWQVLVDLGFTENHTVLKDSIQSIGELTSALTGCKNTIPFEIWLYQNGYIQEQQQNMFRFLELHSQVELTREKCTPAMLLKLHLEKYWKLEKLDRDEVIMYHRVMYCKQNVNYCVQAVMKVAGNDCVHTAMAKTVGLPLAMGAELILKGLIDEKGVCIPASKQWYSQVLPKLENLGIVFKEYRT